MAVIGYARVSTNGQDLAPQAEGLRAGGADRIVQEKVSGARSDRKGLARILRTIEAGDVLLVTRLDRLARSTRDLLNVLDAVTKAGASFRSLGDAWADTTTPHGRLMVTVLGGLAEFERSLIQARTSEGRKRAIERGVRIGRKPKLDGHQIREVMARLEAGEAPTKIARTYGVHHNAIRRIRDLASPGDASIAAALALDAKELAKANARARGKRA